MSALEQALAEIVRILETQRLPYMVIGGIANLVWGVPRATLDIDITVAIEPGMLPSLLKTLAPAFRILPEQAEQFVADTSVLPLQSRGGVRVDLIIARLPYERVAIQRVRRQSLAGVEVNVCSPEDLIIHKIVSERPKDREDIVGIVRQQGAALDRRYLESSVQQLAEGLSRPDLLTWLRSRLDERGA